jgi:uncharacterized protein
MPPLTALLLSDGRPGHYQRAEGILAAIARLRPVETTRVNVHRRRWLPGRALAKLIDIGMSPARLLKLAYGIDAAKLPRADLVVSSGGNTLAANIAAARILGAPNIVYGSVRRFQPGNFSLVLTSYGGHAERPRHRMIPLMPVPYDPDTLSPLIDAKLDPGHPPRSLGLLIGGNAGGFRYRPDDWRRLFAFIADMHAQHGTRWIVANSPRTPTKVSDEIIRRADDAAGPISGFIDVRVAGPGSLMRLFVEAQAIVSTDDSSSMVTEAVWLRRPVIGVSPPGARFAEREDWYRKHLDRNDWTRSIPIAELSPASVLSLFAEIRPHNGNALDLLAATMGECLPTLLASQERPGRSANLSYFA